MSSSKPVVYKTLTLAEKIAVINEVEKGLKKKSQIAKDFGIPATTLSTFLKNKEKILSSANDSAKDRKRVRGPENPDVDECVLKWFKQARDKQIPVSGPMIRAKAEEFASSLNKDFKASTGWLHGFKERNSITFKSVCGESAGVDEQAADKWKGELVKMIQETPPKNIFNADETGLFYKCTPDKTMTFKGERCSGGKLSKDRITLMVGANMDGSEKLPLLMIGKSANPRCFKNVKTLPVQYKNNKKAWMTSEIFSEWLSKLDKKFRKEKRKVLLFIDNCTAHNNVPNMSNVTVIWFPPNMTSVIQPMDQGVIKNLKHFYRRLLVQNIMSGSFTDKNGKNKINVLDAMRMSHSAWAQVTATTVANCFCKAGFVRDLDHNKEAEEDRVLMPETNNWEAVEEAAGIPFDEYVSLDENVAVCGEQSDAEILADVISRTTTDKSSDEEGEEEEPAAEQPILTSSQAMTQVEELRRYVEAQTNVSDQVFQSLNKLEQFIASQRLNLGKQLRVSDFFKKS